MRRHGHVEGRTDPGEEMEDVLICGCMTEFTRAVHRVVRAIPLGETRTYGQVAELAGYPGAARAVGSLMKANTDPDIPCHRVVRGDGRPGEYNRGGERVKARLLAEELVLSTRNSSR